jgi:hypothetical protein
MASLAYPSAALAQAVASELPGSQPPPNDLAPLTLILIVDAGSPLDNQLGTIIGALSAQNLDVQARVDDAISAGVVILLFQGTLDVSAFLDAIPPEHLVLFFGTGGTQDSPASGIIVVIGPPHPGRPPDPNHR